MSSARSGPFLTGESGKKGGRESEEEREATQKYDEGGVDEESGRKGEGLGWKRKVRDLFVSTRDVVVIIVLFSVREINNFWGLHVHYTHREVDVEE